MLFRSDRFADGVWLSELAPIGDPDLVPVQIAHSLGIGEEPGHKPIESLLDYLSNKSLLLLVDNCEHVITGAAELTDRVLKNSPSTAILASSREALGLEGEVVFQVPSLGLPRALASRDNAGGVAQDADWLSSVVASEAVRLFADRAAAVMPSFRITAGNALAVLDICRPSPRRSDRKSVV